MNINVFAQFSDCVVGDRVELNRTLLLRNCAACRSLMADLPDFHVIPEWGDASIDVAISDKHRAIAERRDIYLKIFTYDSTKAYVKALRSKERFYARQFYSRSLRCNYDCHYTGVIVFPNMLPIANKALNSDPRWLQCRLWISQTAKSWDETIFVGPLEQLCETALLVAVLCQQLSLIETHFYDGKNGWLNAEQRRNFIEARKELHKLIPASAWKKLQYSDRRYPQSNLVLTVENPKIVFSFFPLSPNLGNCLQFQLQPELFDWVECTQQVLEENSVSFFKEIQALGFADGYAGKELPNIVVSQTGERYDATWEYEMGYSEGSVEAERNFCPA